MNKTVQLLGMALALVVSGSSAMGATAPTPRTEAAAQATELWGGPGARGAGVAGSRFDTTLYVSAVTPASGTVEFFARGSIATTRGFSIPARGVAVIQAPAEVDGAGAFLFRVRSDSAVTAWSETYNETPSGRFGVSVTAITSGDFLRAGDEASAGGAEMTSSGYRTNVGVLCSGASAQGCSVEFTAYENGNALGSGTIDAVPGSAVQAALGSLISGTNGKSGMALRARFLSGSGMPYAFRNRQDTSDGTEVPFAVNRGAFSTAPVVSTFSATPSSGCSPLNVTLTWATQGAQSVSITGLGGGLPANGSATLTLNSTSDLTLIATASTGASTSETRRVNITPATAPPIPQPQSTSTTIGGVIDGVLPYNASAVTYAFVQQESTGSTFTIVNNQFFYRAGTTSGTDIVRITVNGNCGNATSDFTVTVVPVGAPRIVSFTADPVVGCGPNANIVLSWATEDVRTVLISGFDGQLPANGSYGFTISSATTFRLTAIAANGARITKDLTVPVDSGLPVPLISPNNLVVLPATRHLITVTGVPDLERLSFAYVQNRTGSYFEYAGPGQYYWNAGGGAGNTDIIRIYYSNGCGLIFSTFTGSIVQSIP